MNMNGVRTDAPRVAVFGDWATADLGDRAVYRGVVDFFAPLARAVDCYECAGLRPFDERAGPPPAGGRRPRWLGAVAAPWAGSMRGLRRAVRGLRQEMLIRRLMPSLAEADLICVGGGALLVDCDLRLPQSLYAIAAAAAELRKPLWCLGCGADEPWSDRGRELIGYFLDACELVAPRDRATAERVAALTGRRPSVFGDFALAPRRPARAPRTTAPRLALNAACLPPPWSQLQHWYEETLVQGARHYLHGAGPRSRVLVFTTGAALDEPAAQRVHGRLGRGAALAQPATLPELERLLRDSDAVVATRLHAAALSLAAGTPVVGLSSTGAMANVFDTLGLTAYHLRIPGGTAADLVRLLGDREALAGQFRALSLSEWRATRQQVATALLRMGGRSRLAS